MTSSGMRNSSGDRYLALSCQPNEWTACFNEPQRDLRFGWSPVDDRLLTRALSNQLSWEELFHFNQMCPYTQPFCVGFLPVDVLFAVGRELRKNGKNYLPVMLSLNVYSGNCLFGRNLEKSCISLWFVLEIHKKMKAITKLYCYQWMLFGEILLYSFFSIPLFGVFLTAFLLHRQ